MMTRTYTPAITLPALSPAMISSLLLAACGLCIFAYVYFVAESVLHVVVRQDAEAKASALLSSIATLETELITAQHTISSRLATMDGYEEEQEKVFLVRRDSGLVMGDRPQ